MRVPIGNGYTIYQNKEDQSIIHPKKFRFYLQSISKDYYDYLKMLQELQSGSFTGDLASAGFAEPIRLPSNVEGGTGVWVVQRNVFTSGMKGISLLLKVHADRIMV